MTTLTGTTDGVPETGPTGRQSFSGRLWSRVRPFYWPTVLALAAVNLWWFLDTSPLPELTTLAGLINAGRTEEAERSLRAWTRRSPHYAEPRLLLARLLAAREDYRGCAEQLRAIPFWSPLKPEAFYREAQTWLKIDRASDAEDALRALAKVDPNHPVNAPFLFEAQIDLINLLTMENRWEDAREVIWGAIDRADPANREEFLVMSLRTLLERSSPSASLETLRRYLAADPDDQAARLALASALDAVGRREESDAMMAECLRRLPEDPAVWTARMEILRDRADPDAFREALAEAPKALDATLSGYRAHSLVARGKLEAAADAYALAIANRPGDAEFLYRSALIARRLGRTEAEQTATRKHRVWRLAREALPEILGEYGREGRGAAAVPARRFELLGKLAEICRDLGMERDAAEWARLRDAARPGAAP